MIEDLWGELSAQRNLRLTSWMGIAHQVVAGTTTPHLALPSQLASQLMSHTKTLMTKAAQLPVKHGHEANFRERYREVVDSIYHLSDECRDIWARTVLRMRPDLSHQIDQVVMSMASLVGGGKDGTITESQIMHRLYVLDTGFTANNMAGGAQDWYQVNQSFQTTELWLSQTYSQALRRLVNERKLTGFMSGDTLVIRQESHRYNEAITELEILFGAEWTDRFMAVAHSVVFDEVAFQKSPPAPTSIFAQLGITVG